MKAVILVLAVAALANAGTLRERRGLEGYYPQYQQSQYQPSQYQPSQYNNGYGQDSDSVLSSLVPSGRFLPAYGQQFPQFRQQPSTFSSDVFDVNQYQRAWGTNTKSQGIYVPAYSQQQY